MLDIYILIFNVFRCIYYIAQIYIQRREKLTYTLFAYLKSLTRGLLIIICIIYIRNIIFYYYYLATPLL